jgi:hypothetical protein
MRTLFIYFLLLLIFPINGIYDWSFQQKITLSTAGKTFGKSPSFIVGRGFLTLISGYNTATGPSNPPGVFIHTTDEGFLQHKSANNYQYVWSQQGLLSPPVSALPDKQDLTATGFGKWMVASNQTLIISAPYAGENRGFAFIFNGTGRHWSFMQRLQSSDPQPGDYFGDKMTLSGDLLIVGSKGTMPGKGTPKSGAAFIFRRPTNGLTWSNQGRLLPRDALDDQLFGEEVSIYDNTAVISARNDEKDAVR